MPSLVDSGKVGGRPFSVRQVARQCNLSFPLSLREFIRTPGCPFTRCLRLHIKVLTEPALQGGIETMLKRMHEIYSTAGISVVVASRENLTPTVLGADFTTFNALDVGGCFGGSTTRVQDRLFGNQNNVPDGQRRNQIIVYFVRNVVRTLPKNKGGELNGCASFPNGQPGAVVSSIASQWTLAHEVGHVLNLKHIAGEHTGCPAKDPECCNTPDRTRLMTGCSTSKIIGTPTLAQSEINTMTSNDLTHQC